MKINLNNLSWRLSGWTPYLWMLGKSMEIGEKQEAEIQAVPATVPGSVQLALKNAGIIPDWNYGDNARQCEWVENRHWAYTATVPEMPGKECELSCSLDGSGWVVWDGKIIAEFSTRHRPHVFRLPTTEPATAHTLSIVFDNPPRWLGQFGHTSKSTLGKPRFYYTRDWIPRLVQTAITSPVEIREVAGRMEIEALYTGMDSLYLRGKSPGTVSLRLRDGAREIAAKTFSAAEFSAGVEWRDLPVERWFPNGHGVAKLYELEINGKTCRVGFRHIAWKPCHNAPADADPWLLELNGSPVFIQGVNWTPIRPNYADVKDEDYRKRLEKYREIGINMIRVWGGATIERDILYDLCDELGIMVWQEFPMSSSGVENLPPSDETAMAHLLADAEYYLSHLVSHVSLTMWCGGNELQRDLNGNPYGCGKPCTLEEPLLAKLAELTARHDPTRRFMPSSASGPREFADATNYGKGLHWDVHGPWKAEGLLDDHWRRYWDDDDALFRSEVGSPGASPMHIIKEYGNNWNYPLPWWNEHGTFRLEHGRDPESADEYVAWSQRRQSIMLHYIAAACKKRFPACGGIIIWMGHDCFPGAANTSILDYDGEFKPAALALREIFRP